MSSTDTPGQGKESEPAPTDQTAPISSPPTQDQPAVAAPAAPAAPAAAQPAPEAAAWPPAGPPAAGYSAPAAPRRRAAWLSTLTPLWASLLAAVLLLAGFGVGVVVGWQHDGGDRRIERVGFGPQMGPGMRGFGDQMGPGMRGFGQRGPQDQRGGGNQQGPNDQQGPQKVPSPTPSAPTTS